MPDDAARWRSSLHFARLIRNNRSPLTQSQSWSPGQERNHSWRSWIVGPRVTGNPEEMEFLPVCRPTVRNRRICCALAKRCERIHGPHFRGFPGPAIRRDDVVHAQVFHGLAQVILGSLAAQELT